MQSTFCSYNSIKIPWNIAYIFSISVISNVEKIKIFDYFKEISFQGDLLLRRYPSEKISLWEYFLSTRFPFYKISSQQNFLSTRFPFNKIAFKERLPFEKIAFGEDLPFEKRLPFEKISSQEDFLSRRLHLDKIAFWEDLPFEKKLPFERISFQEDWLPFKKIGEDFFLRKFPFKKFSYNALILLSTLVKRRFNLRLKSYLRLTWLLERTIACYGSTHETFFFLPKDWKCSIHQCYDHPPPHYLMGLYLFFSAIEENESYFCGKKF